MIMGYGAWKRQKYLLDRMSLEDLVRAYLTYPAIQVYFVLAVLLYAASLVRPESPLRVAGAVAAAALIYPLVWYLLHRYVLHGRWLYKSALTASLWKRIHYDHHQNTEDLSVLFGGLHTTRPTIVVVTGPVGWIVAGPSGAAAAVATAALVTCFYEFCHCIQHLAYRPRSAFLKRIKRLHLAHHHHNENGNYGITNFFWDKLFSTYYGKSSEIPRSPTVRNLGYTDGEAERYPWTAALSRATEGVHTPAQNHDDVAGS